MCLQIKHNRGNLGGNSSNPILWNYPHPWMRATQSKRDEREWVGERNKTSSRSLSGMHQWIEFAILSLLAWRSWFSKLMIVVMVGSVAPGWRGRWKGGAGWEPKWGARWSRRFTWRGAQRGLEVMAEGQRRIISLRSRQTSSRRQHCGPRTSQFCVRLYTRL